jgi:hypothetical protein
MPDLGTGLNTGVVFEGLGQLWQHFAQRPLNALHCLDDVNLLLGASAAVKGYDLQSVADVVVHVGNHSQPAFDKLPPLSLAYVEHIHQGTGHKSNEQGRR